MSSPGGDATTVPPAASGAEGRGVPGVGAGDGRTLTGGDGSGVTTGRTASGPLGGLAARSATTAAVGVATQTAMATPRAVRATAGR